MFPEIEDALDKLMSLKQRPDAILAMSDKLTSSCLKYFKTHGIRVPGDIALAGFSNSEIAELLNPSLTVIRQPAVEMGITAAKLLMKLIESKKRSSSSKKRCLNLNYLSANHQLLLVLKLF